MLPLYAVDRPRRRAVVTWGIVAANVAVFIGELVYTNGLDPCLEDRLFYAYGLVPYSLANGIQLSLQCSTGILSTSGTSPLVYLTPVTSMFLHADFLHIGGNMLFLLVFGGKIEELFGRARYLVSYLACGIVGGLAMVALSLAVGPPNVYEPVVGASGAISGVMAAYLVLDPRGLIITLAGFIIVPIRAFWFIGGWYVLQVVYMLTGVDTGTAYMAHIGGFGLGLALALVVRARSRAYRSSF